MRATRCGLAVVALAAVPLAMGVAFAQAGKPRVLEQHAPAYPPAEEAARHGGRVVLRVSVSEVAAIEAVDVTTSTGFPALDQAAVEAVKTWRFAPATDDTGKPVAGVTSFALKFTSPIRELDVVSTCAQITGQVAALRAASADASLEQIPAIGALRDMAEVTDSVLPAEHRGAVIATLPGLYEQVLARCADTPDAKFMDAYFEVTKVKKTRKK